uniref:p53-mediated apoptosis protein EI24/PIG8 n=1 Tax=Glossina morsitans morsitans TaxID=37546 RepID=D3TNF1_GLOMM
MEFAKNITLGFVHGFWDSIKGMTFVFYIDAEIAEQERQNRMRRSPSPVPSSASAMILEQERQRDLQRENPDERNINSVRNRLTEPRVPPQEKKIAQKVFMCCVLNGGFTWLSIILFEQLLLPTLKFLLTLCYGEDSDDLHLIWGWLQSILSIIFGMMWVLPIFLLSKFVSSLWFADIANEAYKIRKGKPQLIPSLSKLIADFLFSLVVQALFLIQSMLVSLIPITFVGNSLCFLHLCMLYSLYCFEYKWINMGWELHRRLSYIEMNWPYFLGFGIPLTFVTNMTNSLIASSCIFSIFFPLFILSGNEARPLVGTTETPIRLFSPVIFVANLMFAGRQNKSKIEKVMQRQQQPRVQEKLLRQRKHSAQDAQAQTPKEPPKYRYPQPPEKINPSLHRTSEIPMPMRYRTSARNFIPTPAPTAPISNQQRR